jgi:acyl-coenzyme A thioesterase PaaI-like protein
MNFILDTYNQLLSQPDGKQRFSEMVCEITPYFKSINPLVVELRPGFGKWSMKKVKEVQNHIGTVHAIAMCNLCEVTAGLATEVSIPDNKRWIPIGMDVEYLKKATTDLTASCFFENIDWDNIETLNVEVSVKDINEQEVMKANIKIKISDKA